MYTITREQQQVVATADNLYSAKENARYYSTAYYYGTTYVFGPDGRRLGTMYAGRWVEETQVFIFGKGYQ